MSGQGSPLQMLFSHKIHFTSSPALSCPPCYIPFSLLKIFYFPWSVIFDIKELLLKCSSHSYPQPLLFFLPQTQNMESPSFGDKALAGVFITRAPQMHNSPIWGSAYFSQCPGTNLSSSLLTFSIYSKVLMGAEWMKRKNFKYPNVVHYLT